jgi:hypothetical protein
MIRTLIILLAPLIIAYIDISMIYQILLSFWVLYLLLIGFYRPYRSCIHNTAIFINELALVYTLSLIVAKDYSIITDATKIYLEFGMLGLLSLVIFLSLVRSIVGIKEGVSPKNNVAEQK